LGTFNSEKSKTRKRVAPDGEPVKEIIGNTPTLIGVVCG